MSAQVLPMRANDDQTRLRELEKVVEHGQRSFVEVGKALAELRKLYPRTFSTFEDYCKARFGMSRQRVEQLEAAADAVDNLATIVAVLPTSEGVARPLTSLPAQERVIVWEEALARHGNKPTAAQVSRIVRERHPKPEQAAPEIVGFSTKFWFIPEKLEECARAIRDSLSIDELDRFVRIMAEHLSTERMRRAQRDTK